METVAAYAGAESVDFCLPRGTVQFNLLLRNGSESITVSLTGGDIIEDGFMPTAPEAERHFLRHTLATVAYRGAKPLRDAPPGFGTLEIANYPRTPGKILTHINDLFDWALSISRGKQGWHDSTPGEWASEVTRFFHAVKALDDYLASEEPLHEAPTKLFQGPIADALTHIGQIAMLRRLAGHPIKAENYHKAAIASGQVGPEQPAPQREFD